MSRTAPVSETSVLLRPAPTASLPNETKHPIPLGRETPLRSTRTDKQGKYTFGSVLPGKYIIELQHPGFGIATEPPFYVYSSDSVTLLSILVPQTPKANSSAQDLAVAIAPRPTEKSVRPDTNTLVTWGSFVVAALSSLANIYFLKNDANRRTEIASLQSYIAQTKDYAENTPLYVPHCLDVIMLGPRNAGKSALCELWAKPWADISKIAPSDDWVIHNMAVCEGIPFSETDPLFRVKRTHTPQFRLRILDYPGEDHLKYEAMQRLTDLSSAVLVLVFPCTIGAERGTAIGEDEMRAAFHKNLDYFNTHFLDSLARLPELSRRLQRVFVVFTKIDVLPPEWSTPQYVGTLLEGHQKALGQLSHLFKDVLDYEYVSSYTNINAITLLGKITQLLLQGQNIAPEASTRVRSTLAGAAQSERATA